MNLSPIPHLTLTALLMSAPAMMAQDATVKVETTARQELSFRVSFQGKEIISESPLGLTIDRVPIGQNVQIKATTPGKLTDDEVHRTYTIARPDGSNYYVDVREFDDGIALRYRIPASGEVCIYGESTAFTFPSHTRTWYASGPFQYGWIQAYQDRETDAIEGELLAPPATFRTADGVYAAITEANLFDFHGAVLFGNKPNQVGFGYVENRGHLETGIITGMPPMKYAHEVVRHTPWMASPKKGTNEIVTPWRVLMLSADLDGLVNNRILANVSDAPDKTLFPQGADTEWIKPARATFTWLTAGGIERLSVANHQKFVDGCSEMGIEAVVVDDGWEHWQQTEPKANGRDKWQMLKDLVDYAAPKKVDIWVWRPSSPRSGNNTDIGLVDAGERARFMKSCAEAGVKGIKIDFFHTENRFTVNLMENILRDAAKEKLLVIFHGVNKPTGDSYTYPNLLAKEAVRGLECVGGESSWAPGAAWPYHNTVLPFTRWLVGAADYTPMNFRAFCPASTTFAHQLSSIYMLTSPMLIFAADMEDMLASPGRSFIEEVPVKWDETRVLPESQIGDVAALARRKGDVWYLTVLNGEKAQSLETTLSFLPKGKYTMEIATDTPGNRKLIQVSTRKVSSGQKLKEELMAGGGFVAKITPVAKNRK